MALRCGSLATLLGLACCAAPPQGAGTTTSAGGVGASSSSGSTGAVQATGGRASGGLPSDGGCVPGLRGTELTRCESDQGCGCPQRCAVDPELGTTICELPCQSTADCPSAVTRCGAIGADGGRCQLNFCWRSQGGADVPGEPGGSCGATAVDAGDGTCIPALRAVADGGPATAFAYCVPNGSASASCNPATADNPASPDQDFDATGTSRAPGSDYCPAGQACVPSVGGLGACTGFCAPGGGGCPAHEVCLAQDPSDETWGLCGACIQAGQACLLAAECCTGSCDPVNGCAGGCDPTTGDGC